MTQTLDERDLDLELLASDQIHFLETLREHGLEVALDIGGRTRFEEFGNALLEIVKEGLLVHVSPR